MDKFEQEVVKFNGEPKFEDLIIGKRYNTEDLRQIPYCYFYLVDTVYDNSNFPIIIDTGVLINAAREPQNFSGDYDDEVVLITYPGGVYFAE